ncbi:MAG: dephospho-CoA kinase [Candidatus Omnitrophica bacterium]|nr:dephospho-CoA kinase [Candidatus Omnitrophota bacterium]
MIVIGLTGGVGTGKSTVAAEFKRLGARVLDADRLARGLMEPGRPVFKKIVSVFGKTVLGPGGRLDRGALSERVFRRGGALKKLTGIVHPEVRRQIRARVKRMAARNPASVVVLDVPLLLESKGAYRCDALVVVTAPAETAARRLRLRSGWSVKEIKRRGRFQWPLARKAALADFVVRNGGSRMGTRRQVVRVFSQIVKEKVP